MGKSYCKIEHKWCKGLKKGVCTWCNKSITKVPRCPRLTEIETVRFATIVASVDFDKVFDIIATQYPDQADGREKYNEVFNRIHSMTPLKHNLTDIIINIEKVTEDDKTWYDVHGKVHNKPYRYSIEFDPWINWISYFVSQTTLDSLTYEEIVAHCLWEMTYYGFDEKTIQDTKKDLIESVEECKRKIDYERESPRL